MNTDAALLTAQVHAARRARLQQQVPGDILIVGNAERIRNLPINNVPFRQDSSLLYLTGCSLPGTALLISGGESTLFAPLPAPDDALWHGVVWTADQLRERYGVDAVRSTDELDSACAGRSLHTLAVGDDAATARAARLAGIPLAYGSDNGSPALIDALIDLRRTKTAAEMELHRQAAAATADAFTAAMSGTHPGGAEQHIAALFDGVLAARGYTTGYQSIVTVRGEVLHNHHYTNPLQAGQLLLLDGGGEGPTGYGVDITRTWPVDGRFSGRQRAAYEAVLESQRQAIALCVPGTRYRDVHVHAARVLAQWMLDEGLLRGSLDAVMEAHAAAVFFPHGVGHLLGMDVHDLEQFGDRAGYAPGRERDPHFGTAYLRMDLDLEPGFFLTIEPGFYVVPAILNDAGLRARFGDLVNWELAQKWVGFGGIRIEDDILVTSGDPDVVTAATPKTIDAIEALVGTGRPALERLSP